MKKTCLRCERELEATRVNFHKDATRKDGLYVWCVVCRREYVRQQRAKKSGNSDPILLHSPFKRGDVCTFRGRRVRVSHGLRCGFATRIAVFPTEGVMRKPWMVSFRQFVAEAQKETAA